MMRYTKQDRSIGLSTHRGGKLGNAIRDLRYLLDHGYPRDSAVTFVANHYRIPAKERHLLTRCVFSKQETEKHRKKAVGPRWVKGKRLGVDGYNVLITVEGILAGRHVIRCDDGFVRDLQAIFGKYRTTPLTPQAKTAISKLIALARPERVDVLFDQQVSRSGELAASFREEMKRLGIEGDARTVAGVDYKVRGFEVVASSDRAIIARAKAVWDIPAEVAKGRKAAKVLDLTKL